jgi:hypothetical protein
MVTPGSSLKGALVAEVPEDLRPLFEDDGKFYPDLWWWSFDTFIISLVARAARKLREDGHGHPGDCSVEEWHAYLKSIEDDLDAYGKADDTVDAAGYVKAQDAMRRFVDRMGHWWD